MADVAMADHSPAHVVTAAVLMAEEAVVRRPRQGGLMAEAPTAADGPMAVVVAIAARHGLLPAEVARAAALAVVPAGRTIVEDIVNP
jgi:hypothetical protein